MESAARQAEILSTLPRVQNCHMTAWDSQVQNLIDNVFTGEFQAAGKTPETRPKAGAFDLDDWTSFLVVDHLEVIFGAKLPSWASNWVLTLNELKFLSRNERKVTKIIKTAALSSQLILCYQPMTTPQFTSLNQFRRVNYEKFNIFMKIT